MTRVVIVGTGHAGVQAAASLRDAGFDGCVTLLGDETVLPYQRPPLSKEYLSGAEERPLGLRGAEFYRTAGIELRLGVRVEAIDRVGRRLWARDGTEIPYDRLILATGARARRLPVVPEADGVHHLRTLSDSTALRRALPRARRVVVVGGGFLGLEFAAAAVAAGRAVTVVEAAPLLMGHAVSRVVSSAMATLHAAAGVRLLLGEQVTDVRVRAGAVRGVTTASGLRIPADLLLVGVGAVPNDELARAADLAVGHGVLVDPALRTADPAIWAVGDCARVTSPGGSWRLESVQNATDQARHAAAGVLGDVLPYAAVPWFWSDQKVAKLQIAGLRGDHDRAVVRGSVHSGRFSVLHFADDRLTCVESVGRPSDHLAGRLLLETGTPLSPAEAGDPDLDLRALARERAGRR